MQAIYPGQSNTIQAPVVAVADNTAIKTGTVYFYLRAKGGTYDGYWLDGSVDSTENIADRMSETEAVAGSATYIGGALWELTLDAAVWMANVQWQLYWAESGDLHKPDYDMVVPMGAAYDGTVETTPAYGIVDICNYAIALIGKVAQANIDYLETYSGNPSDDSSQHAMAWMQRLYPFARDYAQIKLQPRECLAYIDPGAELDDDSANVTPGWGYLFSRPTNCLLFLGVVVDDYHDSETGEDKFLPHVEIGDQIACDYDDDILFKYIVRRNDTTKFSDGLKMCTAHWLSYLAARPMGIDAQGRMELFKEFGTALNEARLLTGQRLYRRKPERTLDTAHRRTRQQVLKDDNGMIRLI
jgi:hypothetical protein